MNVGYTERTHTASLWELRHLLGGDGPDVTLQVLLLHLHLLRQLEQQTGRAAQVEDCLREDWPKVRDTSSIDSMLMVGGWWYETTNKTI